MKKFMFHLLLIAACFSCGKSSGGGTSPTPTPTPSPDPAPVFAKGADVGWLTQMEASGIKFYNSAGVQKDAIDLLKSLGMNTIRLRVWVNPSPAYNDMADVVAKASDKGR